MKPQESLDNVIKCPQKFLAIQYKVFIVTYLVEVLTSLVDPNDDEKRRMVLRLNCWQDGVRSR